MTDRTRVTGFIICKIAFAWLKRSSDLTGKQTYVSIMSVFSPLVSNMQFSGLTEDLQYHAMDQNLSPLFPRLLEAGSNNKKIWG